ncbi:MAG: bifunctional oligoribonuclease/PAP phosphatase NrnA [Bacteroidales bacterium]|jgi:phosphoesterase RecJ-like protein|nr:bifunctional oligoribonuclease/PAP phosphatase NrnA [Bacteroidales bacterium]
MHVLEHKHQIARLKEELSSPKRVLITTHQGPDGDAMGASLAFYQFLKKMGHDVAVVTPNDYPEFLNWLPHNGDVVNYMRQKVLAEDLIANADYIFHLDYNQLRRSADMTNTLANATAVRVMIDHHPEPNLLVKYSFSDTTASSTCELLLTIMQAWNNDLIDSDIATCIYTGVMTDTGCFSFPNATARTFTVASVLLSYGIDRTMIYDRIYDNFSAQRMRLMGYCLNDKMEVFPEYRTALISLNLEEQRRYDFVVGDSEGFVNLPLSIKGIRFSAFFLEKEDKVKISFRSKGDFSTNDFARKHFKGGGHLNASGGETKMALDAAIRQFRELLPAYQKALNAL